MVVNQLVNVVSWETSGTHWHSNLFWRWDSAGRSLLLVHPMWSIFWRWEGPNCKIGDLQQKGIHKESGCLPIIRMRLASNVDLFLIRLGWSTMKYSKVTRHKLQDCYEAAFGWRLGAQVGPPHWNQKMLRQSNEVWYGEPMETPKVWSKHLVNYNDLTVPPHWNHG